ncbi:MAG: sulfate transporter [Actinomycetia bacterium]|jgi:anti-anti-sigma factor|nr:sulfate transporter [Actinomycetes bacterium]MDQ1461878.1 anti-sigma factor antagonist [Actinomycetota bacterium]
MATQRFFLRGDVDIATAPAVQHELDQWVREGEEALVLDCCGLTFIDSSGVAVIVKMYRALAREGRQLQVVNADDMTARVLDVLGLTAVLHVNEPYTPSTT